EASLLFIELPSTWIKLRRICGTTSPGSQTIIRELWSKRSTLLRTLVGKQTQNGLGPLPSPLVDSCDATSAFPPKQSGLAPRAEGLVSLLGEVRVHTAELRYLLHIIVVSAPRVVRLNLDC